MTEPTTEAEAPTGDAAVAAVAEHGENSSPEARVNALAFLMGEEPAPNTGTGGEFELTLDVGDYGSPKYTTIRFRALRADELDEADELANEVDPVTKRDKGINVYTRACAVMAKAQVDPPLGPIVEQRNAAGGKFVDSVHLLRQLFARAPGVPMRVEQHIRRRSRTDFDDSRVVREIEAGKG